MRHVYLFYVVYMSRRSPRDGMANNTSLNVNRKNDRYPPANAIVLLSLRDRHDNVWIDRLLFENGLFHSI